MNRISTPIYMDNVACFGFEDKLIDCSHHTDTSEDDHSTDIRVHCTQSNETHNDNTAPIENTSPTADAAMHESTSFISVAALTVALIVCVLLVILAIIYIVHQRQKLPVSSERLVVTCMKILHCVSLYI